MGLMVEPWRYNWYQRLQARIPWLLGYAEVEPDIFLGYCGDHGYYTDFEHTKTGPRCPECEMIWLLAYKRRMKELGFECE